MSYRSLLVFVSGTYYMVAENASDALTRWGHLGLGHLEDEFQLVPSNQKLSIKDTVPEAHTPSSDLELHISDDVTETRTAAEWAEYVGKGFLCCHEEDNLETLVSVRWLEREYGSIPRLQN